MATPTVTQISSYTDGQRGNGQNLRPTTAYRITGGTADDRLTMDEIVADSTMAGLISFDPDTGVVKRVGATPTPYTFIFGSATPQTQISSSSTTTVLNVSDATGFTTTGRVRVNNDSNREREISSISGNQITLATALPSSPNNGQRVKFLEDPDEVTPDCYLELVGITFDLYSNAGTDTSAQDLGDTTDKIIFSDYCDVMIGSDVGDPTAPDVGNCNIITENFSWNFYNYVEIFQELTKVTCNAYLKLILKGNSRPSLVNRNTNSTIRVILGGHSVSPFADNFRCNVDLSVDSQEIIMYGGQINFRPSVTIGSIQSDEFVLPAATAANGGTVYLYWQNSPFATTGYTVRGLQTIREVGETEQPQVDVQSADGSNMLVKLTEFGGKKADEFFRFSADDGHLTTEISQKINFKIRDAANTAVSASRVEVESGSYAITYAPNDLGTPTIAVTDYGEDQSFQNVSDQSVEIPSKVFACNEGINQDFREVSASSIASDDLSPFRYSIWAWGYNIIYQTAFTLEDEMGEADLVVVLPEDNLVTAPTKSDVVSAAATFDDIYDQLAEYAFDNNQDIACSVENGILTFSDSDVTLANGGSMSRASDAITVPCDSTVAAGTKITQLKIDGTATLESGVVVTGTYQDTNGIRVIVAGYPAGTRGSVAFWLASQGEKNREDAVTAATFEVRTDVQVDATNNRFITTSGDFRRYGVGATLITSLFTEEDNNGDFTIDSISADGTTCDVTVPAGRNALVDEAAGGTVELENGSTTTLSVVLEPDTEYFMVADAVSYLRSSVLQLNTGQTTAVRGSLRRITDAAGNDLIPAASDLTDEEIEALKLIKYEVGNDVIRFGATNEINEFTFRAIARAIEVGQSRPNALLNEFICLISEGSFSFEADSGRMITRDSGVADDLVPDLSSFQFTKIGTTDTKDFVDYSNGAIVVNSGIPAVITVALDVDDVNVTQDTWDARMLAVPNSTKNEYKGSGGGTSGTDPLDVVGASIFGENFKGEWAAGDYAVDDVVWHVDSELFYKCTVLRDSTHTDDPSIDTSSWEVAKVEAGGGSGSLDQTTFNTRMANVPDSTKDTYKGSGLSESGLHTGLDNYTNKDDWKADISSLPTDNTLDQSDFDAKMAAVPTATKDTYKGSGLSESGLHTGLDNYTNKDDWKADVSSIPTSTPPTAADIVAAIQAADFEDGTGTNTLAQMLSAIKAVVDDNNSNLENGTYGLSTLATLIGNIPTSNPTTANIVAAIQAADFGSQTLAEQFNALLDMIGSAIFGDAFEGTWAAGDYAVDDVVWFTDKFYKCSVARDSTHTDDPSVDTSSWEVAQVEAGSSGGGLDQTAFNTRMANVPDATKDTYKGAGLSESGLHSGLDSYTNKDDWKGAGLSESGLHSGLDSYTNKDNWKADVSSIPTSNPSAADIVAAIQAADFEEGSGTDTLIQILADIKSVIDDNNSHLENGTYGLSALGTLIGNIPTSNPSTANIVSAIQAADFGSSTVAEHFEILLGVIGSSIFGEDFKGEWVAGIYAEEDVVWFTNRFYTCTDARVATDTDDPATDTASWRIASGMVYSQVINSYYNPFET